EMAARDSRYYLVKQFENPANAASHKNSTAWEILEQMDQGLDAFVCGIGSGGTLTGVAEVLKKERPNVRIVGVEPWGSAVLSGREPGPHKLQGIGAGFIPPVLKRELVDEIIAVRDEDAIKTCRELARKEALLLGISSGAAVYAALKLAEKMGANARILAIAPDGADKYMSTELFAE
ncbi:MAG TPA: pyridoxal-phosphate dependent enzyme, partial [Syntrophomonadaceae bacterium]|nr:pyridoxal-phosphate dependent enzyme [Syntrophomonadaceae bacterium]